VIDWTRAGGWDAAPLGGKHFVDRRQRCRAIRAKTLSAERQREG
jgi:hypothetical protein